MKSAMTAAAVILAGALLAGCVATSGALKMGPDTYSVVTSDRGADSGAATHKKAMEDAAAQCDSEGLELLVTNLSSDTFGLDTTTRITFRCLAADDPELQRPTYTQAPDTVIEDRRQ